MKKTTLAILTLIATSAAIALSQSILTTPPETPYQRAAREGIEVLQSARNVNLGILRDGVPRVWGTDDDQAVMDLWGANAVAIVTMYESHVAYVTGVLTAAGDTEGLTELATITAQVPAYTKNQDGTVTIEPLPEPTPEPTPAE